MKSKPSSKVDVVEDNELILVLRPRVTADVGQSGSQIIRLTFDCIDGTPLWSSQHALSPLLSVLAVLWF